MNIELLSPMLESIQKNRASIGGAEIAGNGEGASFTGAMQHAIAHVDGQQHAASEQVAAVDSGDSDDLVGAMLAGQQARACRSRPGGCSSRSSRPSAGATPIVAWGSACLS